MERRIGARHPVGPIGLRWARPRHGLLKARTLDEQLIVVNASVSGFGVESPSTATASVGEIVELWLDDFRAHAKVTRVEPTPTPSRTYYGMRLLDPPTAFVQAALNCVGFPRVRPTPAAMSASERYYRSQLDQALALDQLDEATERDLANLASQLVLTDAQVREIHRDYLRTLVRAVVDGNEFTVTVRGDLDRLAWTLGGLPSDIDAILQDRAIADPLSPISSTI